MFLQMFRASLRSLRQHRLHTGIHLFGLSIGIACCILLGHYLYYEWTHDSSYPHADRIYRVIYETQREGQDPRYGLQCTALFAPTVENQVPGIDLIARSDRSSRRIRVHGVEFEDRVSGLDASGVEMFGIEPRLGNASTLESMESVLLSPKMASKYFGTTNPVGQTLDIYINESFKPFVVSAVVNPLPENSFEKFDLIINFEHFREEIMQVYTEGWGMTWSSTYLQLEENASPETVEQSINDLMGSIGVQRYRETILRYFRLQPIQQSYMSFHNPKGYPTITTPTASLVLLAIGISLLIVSGVNYTTISLSRSLERTREIGVRKVLGAGRHSLILQSLSETTVLTLIALSIGLLIAGMTMPIFNSLAKTDLVLQPGGITLPLIVLMGILVIIGAGSYPALVASKFSPVEAFKGSVTVGGKSRIQKGLLILQLSVSICLLTSTYLIATQLRHILTRDLGYNTEQVIEIPFPHMDESGENRVALLRSQMQSNPGIIGVSGATCELGGYWLSARADLNGQQISRVYANLVDPDYIPLLDIELVEGRNFDWGRPEDRETSIIVNEKFMDVFVRGDNGDISATIFPGSRIIGVARDFHYSNLHEEIDPMILAINSDIWIPSDCRSINYAENPYVQRVLVRLSSENLQETLRSIQTVWTELAPDQPCDYRFLDEAMDQWYRGRSSMVEYCKHRGIHHPVSVRVGIGRSDNDGCGTTDKRDRDP